MRRLGKTELHRIVDNEPGSTWTEKDQNAAGQYLLNQGHGIFISDIADALDVPRSVQKNDLLFFGVFTCSPRKVVAAFDKVRQDELDWKQGVEVTLRSSDRQLAVVLALIEAIEARDAGDPERTMRCHRHDVHRAAKQIRKALRPHKQHLGQFEINLD